MSGASKPIALATWQREFAESYLAAPQARSLLVAPAGTGKTATSLYVAQRMLETDIVDALLVLSDRSELTTQWRSAARRHDLTLRDRLAHPQGEDGAAVTIQSLRALRDTELVSELAGGARWLLVLDEAHQISRSMISLADHFLSLNSESKALFLSQTHLEKLPFDAEFRFGTEFIFRQSLLELPQTERRISVHAPSFSLLRRLQREDQRIDDLTWRQFEKLVAELLQEDGYAIELMRGTKDGGVDVVAIKDLGPSGMFKGLWQAKRLSGSRRVGISTIRELADTRTEFGASKGVIVTSTFLTRGALQRVERDKYTLAKVDRNDLDAWIGRVLHGERP
jgi:HJR/Mrr/RecB family endonuclease